MRLIDALPSVVVLLGLAACGESQQSTTTRSSSRRDSIAVVEAAAPRLQRPLVASDESFIDAKDVIEDGSRLLVLNGKPEELWELPMSSPHTLRRISEPRQFGQASVRAMVAHSAGISFLGVDGRLRVMSKRDPAILERSLRAYAPMQRPVALGESADGQWLAVHATMAVIGAVTVVDSIAVSTLDASGRVLRVHAFERAGPSRPEAFFLDRISARVLAGRAVLVGSAPARIITVTSGAPRVDTLLDAPERPFDAAELERMRRSVADARTPQSVRESPLPVYLSPVVAALPFRGGHLVVAEIGADSRAADLYCENRFRRTVLSRPSIVEIFVTASGLAVIDEASDASPETPPRLSFYRAEDLIAECAK